MRAIRSVRLTAVIHGRRVIARHVETRRRPIRAWRVQGPSTGTGRVGMHALPPEQTDVDSDSMQGCSLRTISPIHTPPITPMQEFKQTLDRRTHRGGHSGPLHSGARSCRHVPGSPCGVGKRLSQQPTTDLLFETADKLLVRLLTTESSFSTITQEPKPSR